MSDDIQQLIKMKNKINKNRFHLCIETDLENKYKWYLFQNFNNLEDYFSKDNQPIFHSDLTTIEELDNYLQKYNGYGKW